LSLLITEIMVDHIVKNQNTRNFHYCALASQNKQGVYIKSKSKIVLQMPLVE